MRFRSYSMLCLLLATTAVGALIRLGGGGTFEEIAVLRSDATVSGDQYGYDVAMYGDFIVVGTPNIVDSEGNWDAGAAFVYEWNGQEAELIEKLQPSDLIATSYFGTSVAIDGTTIVIGAPGDADLGSSAGAVYVYEYDGVDLYLDEKLYSWNSSDNEAFGTAVAIKNDVILAGSPWDSTSTPAEGSVTVFSGGADNWDYEVLIQHPFQGFGADSSYFGYAVDFDGTRAIIGAPFSIDSSGQAGVGMAFVFERNRGVVSWSIDGYLDSSDPDPNCYYGAAVAIEDDYAAVGAFAHTSEAGLLSVFVDTPGIGWLVYNVIAPFDLDTGDKFGYAIDIEADEIFVGSIYGSGLGVDTGCVHGYEYVPSSGSFGEVNRYWYSALSGPDIGEVGFSISASGSYMLTGAPADDSYEGSALLFGPERFWLNSAGGFWDTGTNWSGGSVPTYDNPVYFGLSDTYSVNMESESQAQDMTVFAGVVDIFMDGFDLIIKGADGLLVGSSTPGELRLTNGTLLVTGDVTAGQDAGVHGTIMISSVVGSMANLVVGASGEGDVTIDGGSSFDTQTIQVGNRDTGGSGNLYIGDNCSLAVSPSVFGYAVVVDDGSIELASTAYLDGGSLGLSVEQGAVFTGSGDYSGSMTNLGDLEPTIADDGDGVLTIFGDYASEGEDMEGMLLTGRVMSSYDGSSSAYVYVQGVAQITGPLLVDIPEGTAVMPGDSFPVFRADSIPGSSEFSSYVTRYVDEDIYFRVVPLARGGGGEGDDMEALTLPTPFGFNPSVIGFTELGQAVATKITDIDADSDDDLIVLATGTDSGPAVSIYLNEGSTLCLEAQIAIGADPTDMDVADMDNDGDIDILVCSRGTDRIYVIENNGSTYPIVVQEGTGNDPSAMCTFDYDNDGKMDVALVNETDDTLFVYQNTSGFRSIGLGSPDSFATAEGPIGIAPGEIDSPGDKQDDIIVAGGTGDIFTHSNTGGTFDPPGSFSAGGNINAIAVTDLDLNVNNLDDILVTLPDTNQAGILYSPPGTTAMDIIDIGGGTLTTFDLDLDGDDDGVFEGPGGAGRGGVAIRILRNDSDLATGGEVIYADVPGDAFGGASALAVGGDINLDDFPDLLTVVNNSSTHYGVVVQTNSQGATWNPGTCDPCDAALPTTCPADVSGTADEPDGSVDVSDLLAVIAHWNQVGDGSSRPMGDCRPLPNGDCTVDVSDLLGVIAEWGSSCTP